MKKPKLYAERDIESLGEFYMRHVDAMTTEGLHDKSSIAAELAWRDAELAELQQTFYLRWNADMRAIARWRKENPGREMMMSDHADLVIWLLQQLELARASSPLPDLAGLKERVEKLERHAPVVHEDVNGTWVEMPSHVDGEWFDCEDVLSLFAAVPPGPAEETDAEFLAKTKETIADVLDVLKMTQDGYRRDSVETRGTIAGCIAALASLVAGQASKGKALKPDPRDRRNDP